MCLGHSTALTKKVSIQLDNLKFILRVFGEMKNAYVGQSDYSYDSSYSCLLVHIFYIVTF